MSRLQQIIAATLLSTALGGCGSNGESSGAGSVLGGSAKPSDWAQDACKTFPVEAAAKAAGVNVTKAETPGQTGNELTLVSNCNYSSADGSAMFGILLRQSKSDPEPVDQQIAGLKTEPEMTGPSEDVTMPKGKAVWSPKLRTLSYVPGPGRMIVVTPPGAIFPGKDGPSAGELKAKAITIANAIES